MSNIFQVVARKPIGGRTDGRTGATLNASSSLRLRGHTKTITFQCNLTPVATGQQDQLCGTAGLSHLDVKLLP